MNIWEETKKPILVLAPMDDVTDSPFRRIVSGCAKPDLFFTEFVSVDGLSSHGREQLIRKLSFTDEETPIIAQIWGLIPDNYQKITEELVDMGFAGVDINMGCPDKTVVKNGCCSALINNRPLAKEIIAATKAGAAGKIPVSVKTRTGFNKVDTTWHEFLLEQDLDALIVHGRTTAEMSKVPNRWDVIEEIRQLRDEKSPGTVYLGNGDVKTRQEALELAKKHKLDGVMIGRGVFSDPFVFSEQSNWLEMSPEDKLKLYLEHIDLFEQFYGDKKNPATLKKFAKVYINGYPGASERRAELMQSKSLEDMRKTISKFTS